LLKKTGISGKHIASTFRNYLEDVGDIFLRNVGLLPRYMALQPRRLPSSVKTVLNGLTISVQAYFLAALPPPSTLEKILP
jgi:hypothetical protein